MADPKRGDAARATAQKEPKPEWTKTGITKYREWVERRWPDKELETLAKKALEITEKGPSVIREADTWWRKIGNGEIDVLAEQLPKPGRDQKDCEDRVFCLPDRGLFIVNDGMGGHDSGEIAAALLGRTTAAFFPKESAPEDGPEISIKRGIVASQNLIDRYGKMKQSGLAPGTCTAIIYIHPETRPNTKRFRATVACAGDTEIYRLRPDGTVDVVYRGSRIPALRDKPQEHARRHPLANIVSHCIGGKRIETSAEIKKRYGDSWEVQERNIVETITEEEVVIQEIILEPGEVLLAMTDGWHDNAVVRRTDEDWRRETSNKPETLESSVAACKDGRGGIDIQLLNQRLLSLSDPKTQQKPDDRGWAIIAPRLRT